MSSSSEKTAATKYNKALTSWTNSKNTKQKDDVIKAKDKICKTTIGEKTGIKTWLRFFLTSVIIGMLPFYFAFSYLVSSIDVKHGKDFTLISSCSKNSSSSLQKNAFTYKHTSYLNPEKWSFWDYCLTQHKWYICNYENANLNTDQFERACKKLFPCAGSTGSDSSMSKTEVLTKAFRWPYLYRIIYKSFKNCFYSSFNGSPNHFLFSCPMQEASKKEGIHRILDNALFILQFPMAFIIYCLWIIYSFVYSLFSPIICYNYGYINFSAGVTYFGTIGILFIYLFFVIASIITMIITSFILIPVFIAYHLLIHPIMRLINDSCLLETASRSLKLLLIIFTYYAAACAIISAMFFGPNRLFVYCVIFAVILIFYSFKSELLPHF